jgi:hypothetical protein
MVISLADRQATWLTVSTEPRCPVLSQADHHQRARRLSSSG